MLIWDGLWITYFAGSSSPCRTNQDPCCPILLILKTGHRFKDYSGRTPVSFGPAYATYRFRERFQITWLTVLTVSTHLTG